MLEVKIYIQTFSRKISVDSRQILSVILQVMNQRELKGQMLSLSFKIQVEFSRKNYMSQILILQLSQSVQKQKNLSKILKEKLTQSRHQRLLECIMVQCFLKILRRCNLIILNMKMVGTKNNNLFFQTNPIKT